MIVILDARTAIMDAGNRNHLHNYLKMRLNLLIGFKPERAITKSKGQAWNPETRRNDFDSRGRFKIQLKYDPELKGWQVSQTDMNVWQSQGLWENPIRLYT